MVSWFFVAMLFVQQSGFQPTHITGWLALSGSPSSEELSCARYSENFWAVSVTDGLVTAVPCPTRLHVDELPFPYESSKDREGNRYVRRIQDGWLVGFDDGEFGGGLWWFGSDGLQSYRLRPPAVASAAPRGLTEPENVLGLPLVGSQQFVLMGLDHLVSRSGRVFRLARQQETWVLELVAVLESEPDPWLVDGDRLLIATETGIWGLEPSGNLRKLHQIELGNFAPSSLVRGGDGALYLGLRHYVLRLDSDKPEWSETWLVPSDCSKLRLDGYRCKCVTSGSGQ